MKKSCIALLGLGLAACAGEATTTPTTTPSGSVVSAVATPSPSPSTPYETSSPSATPSTQTATETPSDVNSPLATTAESPSVIVVGKGQERTLTLSDAFDPGAWEEGAFRPGGDAEPVQAIGHAVGCYSDADGEAIELRFAATEGTLSLDVAQNMDAPESGNTLEFQLRTDDDRLVDTKTVKFKGKSTLSASLVGVAVVKISAKITGECEGQSGALITRLAVRG